ncbi:DUF5011 domain-containing protein [Candidatus Peregrinibacteria bacterium]|nr:DUF5011 domain-containing protein [Candidatus Peregrinibacteria bacterium]
MNKKVLKSAAFVAATGVILVAAFWLLGSPAGKRIVQIISPKLLTADTTSSGDSGYRKCSTSTHDYKFNPDAHLEVKPIGTTIMITNNLNPSSETLLVKWVNQQDFSNPNYDFSYQLLAECLSNDNGTYQYQFINRFSCSPYHPSTGSSYYVFQCRYIYANILDVDFGISPNILSPIVVGSSYNIGAITGVGGTKNAYYTANPRSSPIPNPYTFTAGHGNLIKNTDDTYTYTPTTTGEDYIQVVDTYNSLNFKRATFTVVSSTTITVNPPNPATVTVGQTYEDAGATAQDSDGSNLNVITTGMETVNTMSASDAGARTITYSATGSSGATATATRTVNVVLDTVDPVITVNPASKTVRQWASYTEAMDAGVTANDNIDHNISHKVTRTGGWPVDTSTPGDKTITYSVTDSSGNVATATRTVTVEARACNNTFELQNKKNEKIVGKGHEPTPEEGTLNVTPGQAYLINIKDAATPAPNPTLDSITGTTLLPAAIEYTPGNPYVLISINSSATPGQAGILKVQDNDAPTPANCWAKVKFVVPEGRTAIHKVAPGRHE